MTRDELNLLDYWHVIIRRRWTVYLAVAAATLVAVIGSFLATPLYRATTTLQILRSNPEILTFRDLSQVDYSWASYSDFYQTQYKIIGSKPVTRLAVQRLGFAQSPEFRKNDPSSVWVRLRSLIPGKSATTRNDPLEAATSRVLVGLEVTPVRNSHLVRVAWVSPDPALAAQVANGVAEAYIQLSMESQYSTSGQAEEFLVDQIGKLKNELTEIEARLQQYGESKNIVSIDDSSNITLQALKDISGQRTTAQTTLASAEAKYTALLEAPPEALPDVMHSPLIALLRQEYADLETELAESSERFGDAWPGVQTLRSKLDQARRRLDLETELIARQVRASAEADYLQALNEVRNLDRLLDDQETAAQRLKRDAVEFANLQNEAQKKRETLGALLSRQNEMALSTRLKDLDVTSSNIRIIDRAKAPRAPFRPNTKVNALLGLLFGLGLGMGLAILLDHLDNTISSVDELRRVASCSVLAVVPRHGAIDSPLTRVRRKPGIRASDTLDLVSHLDGKAGAAEAYRDLRTSLLLSNPGRPPRTILITSAAPEEGKTATAINLAIVLAQLGARVLLVDTDLRRPRLHKAFGIENRQGVSNGLSGLEADLSRLAVATSVKNLDLLPSGPIPPNPSELLNSSTFEQQCRGFQQQGYDHIVFDSPPTLSVADPVIIASVVESCLLVVRAGRTPRQSVRNAVDKLQQAGRGSPGLVLNDVSPDAGGSHYGYRYYGHYGDGDEERADNDRAGGAAGA